MIMLLCGSLNSNIQGTQYKYSGIVYAQKQSPSIVTLRQDFDN